MGRLRGSGGRPVGFALLALFVAALLIPRFSPFQAVRLANFDGYQRFAPGMRLRLAIVTATQLPLLVTVIDRMTAQGHIPTDVAAGIIGAAVISVTVFPTIGFNGLEQAAGNGERKVKSLPEIPKPA